MCKPETHPSSVEVLFLLAAFPISSNNWVMMSGNGATGFYLKLNFSEARTGHFFRADFVFMWCGGGTGLVFPNHLLST